MTLKRQTRDNLWTLIAAPTIWAGHFLLCYVVAAYQCAPNVAVFQPIGGARATVAALTLAALLSIGFILLRAVREWRGHGGGGFDHGADTGAGRERFLEFSTVLLAALSFISVIFVALPALINVDCR